MNYYFSPFMQNLSEVEMENHSIILSGYDNEIALDIQDRELEEEYGIIDIQYDFEDDNHTLFFSEERFNEFLEEWRFNNQG